MEPQFPPAAIMDGLGAILRLSESPRQEGCAVLRIEPPKFASEHEVLLNHTSASMLLKALSLWIQYAESSFDESQRLIDSDEDDE